MRRATELATTILISTAMWPPRGCAPFSLSRALRHTGDAFDPPNPKNSACWEFVRRRGCCRLSRTHCDVEEVSSRKLALGLHSLLSLLHGGRNLSGWDSISVSLVKLVLLVVLVVRHGIGVRYGRVVVRQ